MATNSVNLGRGNGDGMFYHAAENTALPAYPTASLASAWSEVGSVGEDGITWALARDLDTIKNWAKKIERMLPSDDSETVQAPLISTTAEVMSVLFGEDAVTEETLVDPYFNVSTKALKLYRKVEIYQWVENVTTSTERGSGGSETTTTDYSYAKEWQEGLVDSSSFHDPGHPEHRLYPADARMVRL